MASFAKDLSVRKTRIQFHQAVQIQFHQAVPRLFQDNVPIPRKDLVPLSSCLNDTVPTNQEESEHLENLCEHLVEW